MNFKFLKIYAMIILVSMISLTAWASFDSNILIGFQYLFSKPWGIATLGDTYHAFLIIYLWIAYKENSTLSRFVWFLLVCSFGTIAISIYLLIQLSKLKPGDSIDQLLIKEDHV